MRISRWGGAAALGVVVGLALAAPAHAHHNTVDWTRTGGDCGETTFTSSWNEADHQVANTVLVVQAAGEQHVAPVGTDITVGPFTEDTVIRWRVWGGGERAGDDPPLNNLQALLDYLEANPGGELAEDPPGVAWRNRTVKGCPAPSPSPSPTTEPSAEPTTGPSPDPEPSDPAPGAGGGGDDKPGLPVTGASLPILIGGGAVLAGLGSGALWLTRRRRATFVA